MEDSGLVSYSPAVVSNPLKLDFFVISVPCEKAAFCRTVDVRKGAASSSRCTSPRSARTAQHPRKSVDALGVAVFDQRIERESNVSRKRYSFGSNARSCSTPKITFFATLRHSIIWYNTCKTLNFHDSINLANQYISTSVVFCCSGIIQCTILIISDRLCADFL